MKRSKPLVRYRLRDGDQIPTRSVTIMEIMSRRTFALGVAEVRAGRGYHPDYDRWKNTDDCWAYERGRQWARIAPRRVRLKIDGKITPQAVQWFGDNIL